MRTRAVSSQISTPTWDAGVVNGGLTCSATILALVCVIQSIHKEYPCLPIPLPSFLDITLGGPPQHPVQPIWFGRGCQYSCYSRDMSRLDNYQYNSTLWL